MLAKHCDILKLPAYEREYAFAAEIGRRFRADFAWPEYRLLVEVQGGIFMRGGGGAHSRPAGIVRDIERQQTALLLGWQVLPVTTDQVKNGRAVELVQRMLQVLGWDDVRYERRVTL